MKTALPPKIKSKNNPHTDSTSSHPKGAHGNPATPQLTTNAVNGSGNSNNTENLTFGELVLKKKKRKTPDGANPAAPSGSAKRRSRTTPVFDEQDAQLAEQMKVWTEMSKAPMSQHTFMNADEGLSNARMLVQQADLILSNARQQATDLSNAIDAYVEAHHTTVRLKDKPAAKESKRLAAEVLVKNCKAAETNTKLTNKKAKALMAVAKSLENKYKCVVERLFLMSKLFIDHVNRQVRGNPNFMTTPLVIDPFRPPQEPAAKRKQQQQQAPPTPQKQQ